MKLRGDFEAIRTNLINKDPVPLLDICVGEILREEQRLITEIVMEQKAQNSVSIHVSYVVQGKSKGGKDITNVQCYSCRGFGHIATDCTKKFYNYCKKMGHIIKDCSIWPPKKSEIAYNILVGSSNGPSSGQSSITPEMVQQMIVYAFSTLSLSCNINSSPKPWYFDSGASNHMTNTVLSLNNVKKYKRSSDSYCRWKFITYNDCW
ncbi:hypothetical protein HRI_002070000 [Hibiscus trionum]|uniref:CCHC-type domain-containing protein n=1 Tax=Hibiscus trionum TaxID=183268 RepID=A0A9W7HWJ9_HIBTR|nr:hypothetical protein HRI_002070000 [Hibiscus trionum]